MKLNGAASAATFGAALLPLQTSLALAGCSVDHSGEQADKPTIRIGYQTFPSGDLIVKNNRWLEDALPELQHQVDKVRLRAPT